MSQKKWSAIDTAALKSFKQDGLTDEQIGKKLGRTPDAIREKRSRIGAVKYTKKPYHQKNPRTPIKTPKKTPAGEQLKAFDLPKLPGTREELFKINEAMFGGKRAIKKELAEYYAGATIQKTINSNVGIPGTINIYNHDGEADFTITNLSPQNAVNILAKIISKLIL